MAFTGDKRGPEKREIELHGVTISQTKLQGNWYTPVADRVKVAEHADPEKIRRKGSGYHVVSVQIIQIADRWAYHCMVEYPIGSGVVKPGSDFIDVKDVSGLAKAETSAIGRALGLHGIAIEESIASVEEMGRVRMEDDDGDSDQEFIQRVGSNVKSALGAQQAQQHLKTTFDKLPLPAIVKMYGLQQGAIDSFREKNTAIKTDEQFLNIMRRAGEEFAKIWVVSHGFNGETVNTYMVRENLKWSTLGTAIRDNEPDQLSGLQEIASDLKNREVAAK